MGARPLCGRAALKIQEGKDRPQAFTPTKGTESERSLEVERRDKTGPVRGGMGVCSMQGQKPHPSRQPQQHPCDPESPRTGPSILNTLRLRKE